MTHVTKITKNHYFLSLTKNLAKYIFFTKINFLFKFCDNSNFLIMCNILVMCNLHMICKLPIFPYFTLISNIHHVSNITLHIHIIKIYVNSNIFELISIVHIIGQKNQSKLHILSFSTISPKSMQNFPYYTFRGISLLIPTKFPAREKSSPIPVCI